MVGLRGHPYPSWRISRACQITLIDTRLVIEVRKLSDFSSVGPPLITDHRLLALPPGTPDTWWNRWIYRNREPIRFAGLFLHTRLETPFSRCDLMASEMTTMSADPAYRHKVWRLWRGVLYMWLPLWMPFVLFGVYPAYALVTRRSRRRRRRRRQGLCVLCGYNLTGNVSGICPECGSPCGLDEGEGR